MKIRGKNFSCCWIIHLFFKYLNYLKHSLDGLAGWCYKDTREGVVRLNICISTSSLKREGKFDGDSRTHEKVWSAQIFPKDAGRTREVILALLFSISIRKVIWWGLPVLVCWNIFPLQGSIGWGYQRQVKCCCRYSIMPHLRSEVWLLYSGWQSSKLSQNPIGDKSIILQSFILVPIVQKKTVIIIITSNFFLIIKFFDVHKSHLCGWMENFKRENSWAN
jgi:hypothetical protein